jgi:hypothetical protein
MKSQARSFRRKHDQIAKPPTPPCAFAKCLDTKGGDPIVFIIDDDDGVRGVLTNLFRSVGIGGKMRQFRDGELVE